MRFRPMAQLEELRATKIQKGDIIRIIGGGNKQYKVYEAGMKALRVHSLDNEKETLLVMRNDAFKDV